MRKTFLPATFASPTFASPSFFSVGRLTVLILVLSGLSSGLWGGRSAQAFEPLDWQYHPEDAAFKFQVQAGIEPQYFLLPNPLRLVIDLPDTPSAPVEQRFSGDVSRIRISEFQPGVTRVVMELAPNSVLQDQQVALDDLGNGQWQIRPLLEQAGAIAINPPTVSAPDLSAPESEPFTERSDDAIDLPVLAADAGPEETGLEETGLEDAGFADPLPDPALAAPALELPPVATFSNAIHAFEPLPQRDGADALGQNQPEPLAGDPFVETLPTVPADALAADAQDVWLGEEDPVDEPKVPFLVQFGEPLPGISADFPAAYVPRSDR